MNYTQNEKIEQVTDTTMVVGIDIGRQIQRIQKQSQNWLWMEDIQSIYSIPYTPEVIYAEIRDLV